jgi:hypothetical protein
MMNIEEVVVEVPPSKKEEIPKGLENKNNIEGEGSSRMMDSKLEDVQNEFQVLKLQEKIAKLKAKLKCKKQVTQASSSSSSSEERDEDESSEEEMKSVKASSKSKGDKRLYNYTCFDYNCLPPNHSFTTVHMGKPPIFDGVNYAKWSHAMKMYLISLNPNVWKVIGTGVEFPKPKETPGSDQLQQIIHYNAQAVNVLLSALEKDEYDRVDGLENAKEIWDTLKVFHQGTRPVRKAKVQILEGQLDRFVMLDDESPQEMYHRLKKLVNKVRAYGSRKWNDKLVVERILKAYLPRDTTVVSLIRVEPNLKNMSPDEVVSRIINHEMLLEEAKYVRDPSKGLVSDKKDNIAFEASKKIKKKQVVVESSSSSEEDEDSDDDDDEGMALFIKKYNKFIAKRRANKGYKGEKPRSKGKRICYNCGKHGHFIAQCPYERRSEDEDKKKKKDKTYTKDKKDKKYFKKKSYDEAHIGQEWDFNDESSSSDSEDMATLVIKGNSSISKSLFPNLNKHTYLMAKENKKKVKVKNSSPQCTSSDNNSSNDECDESFDLGKNPTKMLDKLMKQINLMDELLESQEELLEKERENASELKMLLALEKEKNEKLE